LFTATSTWWFSAGRFFSARLVASAVSERNAVATSTARASADRSALPPLMRTRLRLSRRSAMGRSAQIRARAVLLLHWFRRGPRPAEWHTMSLRSERLEQDVVLPDGRVVAVRVGLAEDSYIPRREVDTVVIELWDESRGEHLAGVATVLSADDVDAAQA